MSTCKREMQVWLARQRSDPQSGRMVASTLRSYVGKCSKKLLGFDQVPSSTDHSFNHQSSPPIENRVTHQQFTVPITLRSPLEDQIAVGHTKQLKKTHLYYIHLINNSKRGFIKPIFDIQSSTTSGSSTSSLSISSTTSPWTKAGSSCVSRYGTGWVSRPSKEGLGCRAFPVATLLILCISLVSIPSKRDDYWFTRNTWSKCLDQPYLCHQLWEIKKFATNCPPPLPDSSSSFGSVITPWLVIYILQSFEQSIAL